MTSFPCFWQIGQFWSPFKPSSINSPFVILHCSARGSAAARPDILSLVPLACLTGRQVKQMGPRNWPVYSCFWIESKKVANPDKMKMNQKNVKRLLFHECKKYGKRSAKPTNPEHDLTDQHINKNNGNAVVKPSLPTKTMTFNKSQIVNTKTEQWQPQWVLPLQGLRSLHSCVLFVSQALP